MGLQLKAKGTANMLEALNLPVRIAALTYLDSYKVQLDTDNFQKNTGNRRQEQHDKRECKE